MFGALKDLTRRAAERVVGDEHHAALASLSQEIDHLVAELGDATAELEQRAAALERAEVALSAAQAEIERLERSGSEYFAAIEDMHREREQWKSMFFEQSIQHQGAQAMLGRALAVSDKRLRMLCQALLKDEDEERRDAAGALLEQLDRVAEPVELGKPKEFAEKMLALAASVEPQTDGLAARERIKVAAAAEPEAFKSDEVAEPQREPAGR